MKRPLVAKGRNAGINGSSSRNKAVDGEALGRISLVDDEIALPGRDNIPSLPGIA